jgi:toxin ParE1/3/4
LMPNGATVKVKWLRGAMRDLDVQTSYIAQDDPEMAQKIYAEIRKRGAELGRFPESGRPGRITGTRELVIGGFPYVMPYRVRNDAIEILRVFHTRQKLPGSW